MVEPLRVGIAGLGVVGSAAFRLLDRQAGALAARTGRSIRVTAGAVRDRGKTRGIDLASIRIFDDPVALARSTEIDLFVELMGGDEGPARASVDAALAAGKHVVTANKALLAKHGLALARLAEQKHVALAFEASVAGGIPIVKTLREGLAGNSIERVYGILNGTCNYILSRMEREELSFDQCLKEAQRLGYADAVHELTLVGPGAGGEATASAVVADIADIAKGIRSAPFGLPVASLVKSEKIAMQRHEGGYYIRFSAIDQPGTIAAIAKRMAERQISLQSVMQKSDPGIEVRPGGPVPVVLITYATTEQLVREAVDAIVADGTVAERPQVIRIERQ